MRYVTTKAIILKEVYTGEADKIITALSGEHGKISIYARGARRPKNNLAACTQFLCYSEFVLYKGKNFYSINSAQIIESFHRASQDLDILTHACHMAEIILDTVMENQNSKNELKLLLYAYHMLINRDKPPAFITSVFKLKYLCLLGFTPGFECTGHENPPSFSFEKCAIVDWEKEGTFRILPGTAKALAHIISKDIDKLFSFGVSQRVTGELEYIADKYLDMQLDKRYRRKTWF